eukprot:6146779-Prymnesium_polylepis.1
MRRTPRSAGAAAPPPHSPCALCAPPTAAPPPHTRRECRGQTRRQRWRRADRARSCRGGARRGQRYLGGPREGNSEGT